MLGSSFLLEQVASTKGDDLDKYLAYTKDMEEKEKSNNLKKTSSKQAEYERKRLLALSKGETRVKYELESDKPKAATGQWKKVGKSAAGND